MGLLDDAIREHLDLKRRRGADPTEIERAERDALGPVRRVGEEGESAEAQLAPHDEEEHAYESAEAEARPAPQLDWHDSVDADAHEATAVDPEPLTAEHEPLEHGSEPEPSPSSEPDHVPALEFEPAAPVRAPEDEDEDDRDSWSRSTRPEPGAETVEYDVEDALESEREKHGDEKPSDDDVLEETPEFLQDTPDHDRLWFEQKPPRDFDFDG